LETITFLEGIGMNSNDLKIYKDIGQRIRRIREKKGLSQLTLALALGKTQAYISKLEKGERRISLESLMEISKILNVPVEEIAPELFAQGFSKEQLRPEELIKKIFKNIPPKKRLKVVKELLDLVNA
jgi:transcriptional regulator with XRE-family HTH domain